MKKNIIFSLVLALVFSISVQAQTKQYYNIGWEVGTPVGDFSDYISATSYRGAYFSGNIFLTNAVSVGFKFGYNSYHENMPRQAHQLGDGTVISASSYNYSVSAPIQVGGYYHFNAGQFEPYAGLGLGVNYITEETLVQDIDTYNSQWAFLLNPEIGLKYQFKNSPLAITVKAGYNYNFNTYTIWNTEYKNMQTLNLGVSLGWVIN